MRICSTRDFGFASSNFYGREVEEQIASNADFVVNALGNLAGSDALLELRSRGVSQRPFVRVQEIEASAARRLEKNERALQGKLSETRAKISTLEGVRSIKDAVTGEQKVEVSLSTEQRLEVEALRREMLTIRKQLRAVQRNLREEVEQLETRLQFANIGLVPVIICVIAIVIGLVRTKVRRRYYLGIQERTASSSAPRLVSSSSPR